MLSGSAVLHDGVQFTVQYVTSKGMLDLKSADGSDVRYGVDPTEVTAVASDPKPKAGDEVLHDGVQFTVQYVTSKGMLDLKSADGSDVRYGVDPTEVTIVGASAAPRSKATAADDAEQTTTHREPYDPSGLLGSAIAIWEDGRRHEVTIVELDHTTGRNLLRVRHAAAAAGSKEDEWVERWRLKQGKRVEAALEATARWTAASEPSPEAQRRRPARSVRLNAQPSDADGADGGGHVPEWRTGLRPKLPSSTTFEQRDGVLVTVDKYPDAIARSFDRAVTLERREHEATRQRARELGILPANPSHESSTTLSPLTGWLYASLIRGEAVVEPDDWLEGVSP